MKSIACITAILSLAIIVIAPSSTAAPINWGTKRLPIEAIIKRCSFPVLTLKNCSQYLLLRSEIAWVQRDDTLFPGLPARQVVRLRYRQAGTNLVFDVVQARSLGERRRRDNINGAVCVGYFDGVNFMHRPVTFYYRTEYGLDVLVDGVTKDIPSSEAEEIQRELSP